MAAAPGPSKRKQKQAEYFKAIRDADRNFETLGLSRPQDESKELLQRTRQVNFGLIRYESNPNSQKILESKPAPGIEQPWMDWRCYSSLKESGEPGPIWIQTEDDFKTMMAKLRLCEEMAFDLECHNYHTLKGKAPFCDSAKSQASLCIITLLICLFLRICSSNSDRHMAVWRLSG